MAELQLTNAIKKGVHFLAQSQLDNGGFSNYSWPAASRNHTTKPIERQTTFFPAVMLSALAPLQHQPDYQPLVTPIAKQLAAFLLSQHNQDWTWNYWQRHSPEYTDIPYPDDLDDTATALAALYQYQPTLLSGQAFANMTQTLTKLEQAIGGPYKTWCISPSSDPEATWQDVDVAVNSAIAFLLQLLDINLPNVERFIETAIKQRRLSSPYYPSVSFLLYSLSRWYHGTMQPRLVRATLKHLSSLKNPTSLDVTLAITGLIHWQTNPATIDQLIHKLLDQQAADGSWPTAGFCFDPTMNGQKHLAGSKNLTTALAVEALSKYQLLSKQLKQEHTKQQPSSHAAIRQKIISQAQHRIQQLSPELRPIAQATFERVLQTDQHQHLILFPTLFAQMLPAKLQQQIDQALLIKLGLANVWGWLAYSLYDDIYDQEAGPEVLGVANLSLREVTAIYHSLGQTTAEVFQTTLDTIDQANQWELQHARATLQKKTLILPTQLPDYTPLTRIAERSLGHALGPLAILLKLGYNRYSQPAQSWLNFMYHYITARQLHDDAHDWESDLMAGRLTPVATLVLQRFLAKRPRKRVLLSSATLQKCRSLFWHDCLPIVADQIKEQHHQASTALTELTILSQPQLFQELLDRIARSTDLISQEHHRATDFLATVASY